MNLGSRLKQVLEEKNMTVSQLARESDVPAQTLYAMINRDSNKADMDSMAKLLIALDMDLPEFMQMPVRPGKSRGRAASHSTETEKQTKKTAESESRQSRRDLADYLL